MRKFFGIAILGLVMMANTGCYGTMAKRALSEVVGASSNAKVVPGTSTARFSQFQGVKICAPHSDLGGLVNSRFTSALPGALRDALTTGKNAPFPGGSPMLDIDPEITFYNDPSGMGDLFGSDSYAVVLFSLSADGSALGKVQVVTKTAATRTGPDDMAKSMAKSLGEFFEQNMKKSKPKKSD